WLPGCMALFFVFTVIYFGLKQHETVINRLRAELQNEALLDQLNEANNRLGMRNDELQHRTEVVKRAQVEARHRAGLFASHVERTLLPVIECDRDFRILEWNQAASTTFGYRNDEVADRNLGELLFPSDRQAQIPVFIEKLFRDNQPTMISMALMTRSGQRLPAYLYVTPIVGEDKTPLRIAVIVTESFTEAGNGSRLKGVKQG
ncbi:MAG: PAS domain-containing protein, partial [Betaproteobacteria bacterium]|nr:PAS domain-containing protein [Betaproteobacteria bacterium]